MRVSNILLFQLLFGAIASVSFGQNSTTPIFRKHEVLEVGGGKKVEILGCRGEGPLQECDVIYYTDRRQTGTRMWRNANRLKEEERAAKLAKGDRSVVEETAASVDTELIEKNLAEAAINNKTPTQQQAAANLSLKEAARQADSTARARAKTLADATDNSAQQDSSEMDKVYIPKVTEKGEAVIEASKNITQKAEAVVDSVATKQNQDAKADSAARPQNETPKSSLQNSPVNISTPNTVSVEKADNASANAAADSSNAALAANNVTATNSAAIQKKESDEMLAILDTSRVVGEQLLSEPANQKKKPFRLIL